RVIASQTPQTALPVTAEESVLLARNVDALELSAAEFERVIALTGSSLGLDYRRRLTVGKTIYGKDREVDVLFRDARNGNRLAVEAKYQRVTGTADEKLPYAVLNLTTLPLPGVIVYGGGGFHQGAGHPAQPEAAQNRLQQQWIELADDLAGQRFAQDAPERGGAGPQPDALRRVGEPGAGPQRIELHAALLAFGLEAIQLEQREDQL